jgi:hypothetical protein
MSKKSKRSSFQPAAVTAAKPVTESVTSSVSSTPAIGSPQRSSLTVEFNPDYTPIIKDLKQIGILAGSFVVVLVVLSFILK